MKRLGIFSLTIFTLVMIVSSQFVLASELNPYVIEQAENGEILGNGKWCTVEDGFISVLHNTQQNALSLTLDIVYQNNYEYWIRLQGRETVNVTVHNAGGNLFSEMIQGMNDEWHWVKLQQVSALTPGRHYVRFSDFSGRMKIDQIVIKKHEIVQKQYNLTSDTVSAPAIPTESPWAKQGLNPFATILANGQESVSTTSGVLSVVATDIVVPGRGGVDLVLSRYTSSKTSDQSPYTSTYFKNNWEFGFPKIQNNMVYFPNASVADLSILPSRVENITDTQRKRIYENTVNQYFLLNQHERKTGSVLDPWDVDYYEVFLADGSYWKFLSDGKISEIRGQNLNNVIRFQYSNGVLTGINDTIGRTYAFERSGDVINFVRTSPTRERLVTYTFNGVNLTVEDAMHLKTAYIEGEQGIKSITYPSGKYSEYTYRTYTHTEDNRVWYKLYWVENQYVSMIESNQTKKVKRTQFEYNFSDESKGEINYIRTKNYGYDYNTQYEKLYSSTYFHANDFGMVERTKTIDEVNGLVAKTEYSFWDPNQRLQEKTEYYGNIYETYDATINHPAISQFKLNKAEQQPLQSERWIYDFYGNELYYRDPLGYETKTAYVNATSSTFYGTQVGQYPFYDNSILANSPFHNLPAGQWKVRKQPDALTPTAEASETYFLYDGNGQVKETKQLTVDEANMRSWIITKFEYDPWGNCNWIQYDAGGKPTSITLNYGPEYHQAYLTSKVQRIATNLVSDDGKSQTAHDVTTTYSYYYETGLAKTVTDYRGKTISYAYDVIGRPTKVTYPNGDVEEVKYEDAAKLVKVLDANRDSLTVQYFDGLGRATKVESYSTCDPLTFTGSVLASTISNQYNWQDQVSKVTDENGRVTEYEYDSFGRPKMIIVEPSVGIKEVEVGQILTQGLTTTTFDYDDANRKVSTTNAANNTEEIIKDAKGQTVVQRVEKNNAFLESKFEYDGFGNLIKTIDAEGKEMVYKYNILGQLTQIRYPDQSGAVPSVSPAYLTEKKYYDHYGNLSKTINRNGQVIDYGYNEFNQLTNVTIPSKPAENLNYYYNDIGQLILVTQGTGGVANLANNKYVKQFTYDARNRVEKEKSTLDPGEVLGQAAKKSYEIGYTYDKNGNVKSIAYPNAAGTLEYIYDSLDRMNQMKWGSNTLVSSVEYLPSNLPTVINYGNSVKGEFKYIYVNGQYLPRNISYANGSNHLGVYDYSYDVLGNITRLNNHQYQYDDLGQLVGWNYFQDNENVLLGEEVIWDKTMTSYDGVATNNTVITGGKLQLGIDQVQGTISSSQLVDLYEKVGSSNLIENGSFEVTAVGTTGIPTGWIRNIYATDSTRISIVPDAVGSTGLKSVILDNTKSPGVTHLNIESKDIPVVAGKTYRQSGWVKGSGQASLYLGRAWYDSAGNRLSYNYIVNAVNPAAWTYYEGTVTAPANAVKCRIWCTNYNTNTGAGYFDNLAFVEDTGSSDILQSTSNVVKTTSGYELPKKSYLVYDDLKSHPNGMIVLPSNTQPLFDMGSKTGLNLKMVETLTQPYRVIVTTAKTSFTGPQVAEGQTYDPRNLISAPWVLKQTQTIPKDQLRFVKDLRVDLSCTINNHWEFFGWWGDWDLWVMVKINDVVLDYFQFRTGDTSTQTFTVTRSYDITQRGLTYTTDPTVRVYYLVNRWNGGPVDGGSIDYLKLTASTEVGYPVNPSGVSYQTYKLDKQLEPNKKYRLTVNQVTPTNTSVRYELRTATSRVKDITPGTDFTVTSKQDYYICPYLITSYMGSSPTVNGYSVKEIPPYVSQATVVVNTYQFEKACKTFEIVTNSENAPYIVYQANNGSGYVTATGSNGKYQVTFTQPTTQLTIQVKLTTNATQSITPKISDLFVKAIDPVAYSTQGMLITKDITVSQPSTRLLLAVNDKHAELLSIALRVGTTVIAGVPKAASEINSVQPLGEVGLTGVGTSTAVSYYEFTLPASLQSGAFTGRLEFTLKADATGTLTPSISGYTLFNYVNGYVANGSFTGTTPQKAYTFDTVRVNVTPATQPAGTNITYQVLGSSLTPGQNKTLAQQVNQLQLMGTLTTTNNKVTPAITNIKVTAIGETPLNHAMDATADLIEGTPSTPVVPPTDPKEPPIEIPDPNPIDLTMMPLAVPTSALSASPDRVVGSSSIKIDHVATGRVSCDYTVNSGIQFDAAKLPFVQIWVKPTTSASSISFAIYDVRDARDEKIYNDANSNGIFEVGSDLVKDKWNLVLLDLRRTQYDGIDQDAKNLKIILNNASTTVLVDGISSLPLNEVSYVYDNVGNRVEYHENGEVTTYVYEPGTNRLSRVISPVETVSYEYDYNGNMTSKTVQQVNGAVTDYDYVFNELNQLVEVKKDGVKIAAYSYDHMGLRYKKVDYVKKQTTIYIYGAGTEPMYEEVYNNANLVTAISKTSYLNMGSKRIARAEGAAISYYFTDHLGSTRIIMDGAGKCTYNDYAPFGENFGTDSGERYKFTGKEDDAETGLQYFNARFYDAKLGRFLSEDPIKEGVNWYQYCFNAPLQFVDPTGTRVRITGTSEDVATLEKYLEEATGTEITLDENGYIVDVKSIDDRFSEFQGLLNELIAVYDVFQVRHGYDPSLGGSYYYPPEQTAYVDIKGIKRKQYSYVGYETVWGLFDVTSEVWYFTGKEAIFHELLGHGIDQARGLVTKINYREKEIVKKTEINAIRRTNEMREIYGIPLRPWKYLR